MDREKVEVGKLCVVFRSGMGYMVWKDFAGEEDKIPVHRYWTRNLPQEKTKIITLPLVIHLLKETLQKYIF